MRVISGQARGKRLKAPSGLNTRPITDMIKEALFNVWGTRVPGSVFLDLFAGSGSVGIEALSRGAARVVFVDNSGEAVKIIKDNLQNCGLDNNFEIYRRDVMKALELLKRHGERFDLIYVDPPFTNDKIFYPVMVVLDEVDILRTDGIVVIRTPHKKTMPTTFNRLSVYQSRNYGESTLHYYCRHEEDT